MKKLLSFGLAAAFALASGVLFASGITEETAAAAATGFLTRSGVAQRILPGRSVAGVEARGNLWIAKLEPSGYIEVAGSTKCQPILSFSSSDFAEPDVGSPFDAKLTADNLMVENKEADESLDDNPAWANLTASATPTRRLLGAKPTGTDGTGYTPYVAPLLGATWHQTAPYNDLSPYNYFCGCMATAAGQEIRYWRWPYRYEKIRQTTHGVRDAQFNYSDFVIRPNGLVPFDWDKVKANYTDEANASTPWANDKQATYNAAWLSLWMQSLTGMGYKPGGSGGTRQLAATAEEYWYEKGTGYTYWNDGYEALWAAVKADLDWGSPIQINTSAHQMVIDGYAVENNGTEEEVDWINLNLGYGNAVYWENLKTAVTEGTYSGTLASFQTGFRPQKIVQFEPVPKVSGTSLTLAWHIAPCYANRISGFLFQTSKDGNNVGAGMIPSLENTPERYTYDATGLEVGSEYTFTVTPLMNEGEGTGRANSVTTTIGTPQPAPEIISVSSVACGIELLQQDIFIECAYGSVNKIDLTCSESTTEVEPYSSHLTILPDNKLSVTKVGNVFTVNVDATAMDPKWSGEMLVLTLVAKNGDGTEAYKNLMLRFNSMRQVINGTFDAAEGDSNSPVWFCGDTTIDAKGRAVSFGANAFQGTGKVTLIDSVGGGSFTFAGLDNFKGTLVFAGDVSVTLPSDMTGFEGTLSITSGTYTISNDLPATATVTVAEGANVNLVNANVASTITGTGSINITSGSSVLSGAVTSSVKLYGGDLTIPAGTGDYSTVSVGGGTLKIQLTQAQSILGYDWWLPLYTSGSVKFVLYDGTEVDATTTAANPGIRIAHESDANVWTGTDYATFGETYSAKWANGLPGEGDYVIFKSELNDYMETGTDEGTMMALNLTSPRNLGYVLVKGTDKLEIGVYSGATSALLSTDVLENEVETHITTTYFQPKAVIPHKKLSTSSGFVLSCELDSAYADNLKKHETGGSALPDANYWQGTVVFCNKSVSNLELPNYGNAQSKIRLNGVTGSLMGGKTFDGILELVDYDGAPALNLNAGSSNYGVTIGTVMGTGMFKTSGSATALNILLKDISGWTGSFDLASKTVAIGQTLPASYTGTDGRLHICQAATVAADATWKAAGGLYLGAGGALTVNGAVETKNITTYGAGASVTLEDGAVLQVSAASAGDSTSTLNFKAGTYRVKEGSDAFRETATINFCAASGKHTAIDANGATLTLGPNVFSGSGDVYLTSSKAGGKIVIEGISADYTGTIYCDISCEVSFGDLSKATNCNINVSDVILSRSSSDVGNLTVGLGASLEVTVTKDNQINGCTIDTVTLNDGATMVLKDKTGQVLETFTAEDAVDGKYVLAADPSITAEYLLDYEFNGNMNSVGTDTTGLNIWNGTASYDSKSEKIYMRCKPYINKTFAMPDDEWSVFMRCTLPAANSEKPTMMLMFGKNGGNVFGLVAGTGENTVALASRDSLIGEAVQVSDATTKQHVYAIVKTANRVRLYVDGVLKVDESATVSVSKEFQIGSVKNGNNTSYDPCDDANALIDYMRFYDFAVGQSIIEDEVAEDDDPDPVVDPDATPLEESEGFVTSEYQLAFEDATLDQLTASTLGGKFSGGWVVNKGKDATFCNFVYGDSIMTCEAQIDGEFDGNTPIIKAICLEFAQVEDDVYVKATEVKWKANSTLGEALTPTYNPGTLATTESANGYGFYNLTLVRSEGPAYDGPEPIAVWVAGEFGDDRSAHGGLEFALNGNTTNALGQIVIGSTTTLGATVAIPAGHSKASLLVEYSIPSGAHVDDSVLASMFSAYDLGVLSDSGESTGKGYWYTGSAVSDGSYAFNPVPSIPQEGYLLLAYKNDSGTAAYLGETIATLAGGAKGGLCFSNKDITKIAVGGPTVAGAQPWQDMTIKSVAIFLDEYLSADDLANYKFPAQGAVKPEDSDCYTIKPVASWVNDFKTTAKGDYTLSVSGTTVAKDDTFGSTLIIGDAAAIIDTHAANSKAMTVLVKYRSSPENVSAPVVAFGGQAAVGFDVGTYAKTDGELGVYRTYKYNSTDYTAKFDVTDAPSLSENGGYLLCARSDTACSVYAASTLDKLSGGEIASGITFSDRIVKEIGIGGSTSCPDSTVGSKLGVLTGLVVEKIVVFDGYNTPEDWISLNIKAGETRRFTAGETKKYMYIGTLNESGTIEIANASSLAEGTYHLAEWTTPQQYTTQCAGYGKVGTLVTDGLAEGLSARLIYGARGIYLRVDDTAKQAARKPLVVWCYGDSITEGFNAQSTGANYRILLYQKLEMLGYNVRSTGVYGLSNGNNSVDPSGTALTDQYRWHSAKHGATAGPSTLAHRSNLSENVDTLAIQAGTPDVALLLIGVNDLPEFSTVEPVFKAWTNVVTRLVNNLPNTKIIVSTILYSNGKRTDNLDAKIADINDNYIRPLMSDMPEEWEGHVFLADLNDCVKSTETGIIYSDNLHPDWWGYDQMADGYLAKIIECYPDPDATNFPSQNPIPDAPTDDQLGAANKPELDAYRAGFKKLCNLRVEKGQDVSNIVYDDVNSDAASDNLEKVGYFVEFVRADNHAHKWVWVDMDAFGDADLASVGLPQRNYQQAVTKMHVCSNHGAIDNVAADDDSVTGWIEFSPYDYTSAASNSAAPANYGDPLDWNDTLSESGSKGCMQVFRVMNPSSRELYERPQLMFAFNNFQSQNIEPDFGIGNFAQHFNGAYQIQDWTGVSTTLAKMAPDQYSVKTIEIWTKEAAYAGPEPAAVWEDDFSADALSEFDGFSIDDWQQTHGATMSSVTIDRANQGLLVDFTEAKGYVTVLVKYSNLAASSSNKRVLFATTANSDYTRDRCGVRLQTDSKVIGLWNVSTTANNDADYGTASTDTVPSAGTLAFVYDKTSGTDAGGVSTYVAASGESLPSSAIWSNHALKAGDIYGLAVGGMCRDAVVSGVEAAQGMTITGLAVFTNVLTVAEMNAYMWPSQLPPVDKVRYAVTPEAVWYKDFKTTAKTNDAGRVCTLAVSGTTAPADDEYGSTLTIGDAAAVIDSESAEALTVLVKYRAAPAIQSAPVVTFGGDAAVTFDSGICTSTTVDRQLAAYYSFFYNNARQRAINAVDGNPTLSSDGGYLVCARKYNACHAYVGDSLDNMTGGECTAGMKISNSTLRKIGIGGQTELSNNDANMVPFTGFVVEKVVVFNGYYTPDEIRYIPNPEDGDTLAIGNGKTWRFAAGTTRTYTNIGTLSTGGTIAITNATELTEGVYPLATWTTAQKLSKGYGHVGNLDVPGLHAGLSAELVYGAKAIYLRVWNPTTQAAKGTIKIWPYGDSITEGYNSSGTTANYRVLLAQKLSMLGYNVEMVGCYDKVNGANAIDPAGQLVPDNWKWHSAKHGATAGPTTNYKRGNLCENVDTLASQAGNPDVVLLHIGVNDLAESNQDQNTTFVSLTNVVQHLMDDLPDSKIVVSTALRQLEPARTVYNVEIDAYNELIRELIEDMPAAWSGHVLFADLANDVHSQDGGIICTDNVHPDWWGHDQMAEGWLSVITNKFTASDIFNTPVGPAVASDKLGAANKPELAAYRNGFKLARRIDAAINLDTDNPYAETGDGATENIEKVAYFVEYVRADNNAHKWVWVDMDAFSTTIGDVGLPTANHQQVVTKLHVKSNHNGIDDVAADNDSVTGFVEFSPYDYDGTQSSVAGAPAGNNNSCDWNDTLSTSGNYSCMQVHRIAPPSGRGGQVLFAYNNWQSNSSTAEFGIGNFSQHFYTVSADPCTLDYTNTKGLPKMNAAAYSVKRIEIWTKTKAVISEPGVETVRVPVPCDCKADGLIDTSNRAKGDVLQVYSKVYKKYYAWTLSGPNGTWNPGTTFAISGGGEQSESEIAASAVQLYAGQAVWLARTNPNEDIKLLCAYASGTKVIALESGTVAAPGWNLVASPSGSEIQINSLKEKLGDNDRLLVPTGGAPLNIRKNSEGKFVYDGAVLEDGIAVPCEIEIGDDETIPAGEGFWILSAGTESIELL